jgi:ABC-type sugar transport system permease subunit
VRGGFLANATKWRNRQGIAPYLFIAPFYITFVVFWVGPSLFGMYASLTDWQGLAAPSFIGLRNYVRLLHDETFLKALVNTIWYGVASLVVIPTALLLAVGLNALWVRGRTLYRVVYFLPMGTASAIVAIVFILILDHQYGALNYLLSSVHLGKPDWLGAQDTVKPAVMILYVWHYLGYYMVFFLAALQGIPRELFESAKTDGATDIQAFRHITVPSLRPVILFVTLINTVTALQIFEEPQVLNTFAKIVGLSGGPADAGLSLAQYLYRVAFTFGQLGLGAAIGVVIFAFVMTLGLVQARLFGLFSESES